ncbi:MAG: PorT family protein [Saprospiraceae bacterium]|nr:PorT family protein [Saprospiraceae bacterium]MDW8482689.1 porin family protein [Saprospiraceae bacterium]
MKHSIILTFFLVGINAFAQQTKTSNSALHKQNFDLKDSLDYEKEFRKNYALFDRVNFGCKIGYNRSNIFGRDVDYIFASRRTQWLSGWHLGMQVNTPLNRRFGLKYELLLSTRGASVSLTDSISGLYSSRFRTYYLDLFPISPTFYVKRFQLHAGPYVSLLKAATLQKKDERGNFFTDKSIFGDGSNREDEVKYLQKFDFGIHAGVEYQLPFGLFISVKYMHGLTDIFQYANSYTFEDEKTDKIKIFNRLFVLSIGYYFDGYRNGLQARL